MSSLTRIAHIITKLELGGAQQVALFTVAQLNRAKYAPILIAGEPGLLDEEARAIAGLEFHRVPSLVRPIHPWFDAIALYQLTRLLIRLRPTIVQTHSSKAGFLGRWAARLAGVPIILHYVHGYGFTPAQQPWLRRLLIWGERRTGRITTKVFTASSANLRQGVELGLFTEDKALWLPPGVDLEAIRKRRVDVARTRRELGLESAGPLVGMVAPFKPQKAPVDFVRMAAAIHQQRPDVRFLLVGDGELREAVTDEVQRAGLSGYVFLAGWRRDVWDILRCLDVFVLTSRWEGLPRVYLEALTSGIPVVGTRVDGASDVIRDGVNGFLVEPGDVSRLAGRVLWLLSHPTHARQMGLRGSRLPILFDCHEMVRRQEQVYDQLLSELEQQPHSRAA
ncbi:MAG: glycosyltransferase family 4 protein [Nitrospiraceae bacterium]